MTPLPSRREWVDGGCDRWKHRVLFYYIIYFRRKRGTATHHTPDSRCRYSCVSCCPLSRICASLGIHVTCSSSVAAGQWAAPQQQRFAGKLGHGQQGPLADERRRAGPPWHRQADRRRQVRTAQYGLENERRQIHKQEEVYGRSIVVCRGGGGEGWRGGHMRSVFTV